MPLNPAPLSHSLPVYVLRHIRADKRTTVRLERSFWQQIDMLAKKSGKTWHEWAQVEVATKPSGQGLASWLRVRCLQQSLKGQKHG
jgi:predicted DNA-binding ribbon-helix-helix protein